MKTFLRIAATLATTLLAAAASATTYTENVPAPTSLPLPPEYPAAGGVVIVLTGANGNIYYQFSDPDGAFRGFNNNGDPAAFRGNPFTVNDPISLDCGFSSCSDYFGGSIARMDVRFSAYDGDTQVGGFDEDDINLFINGYDVGSWSGITTEITSTDGNTSFGTTTGFGNNTFNTAWFASTNSALLDNILSTGQTVSQVYDDDPNDNYWDFRRGDNLANGAIETIAPGYELVKTVDGGATTFTQVGEVITYNYVVSNIGSVNIDNIAVIDDKIGAVTCTPTLLESVESGAPAPNSANCSATYTVTQEDVDAQTLTNIAQATGDPEYGSLGALEDTVTLTGPAFNSVMTVEKVATPSTFSTVGEVITYDFTITNEGNTTLTDVELTDPLIPTLSCSVATLLPPVPPAAPGAANQLTCSGTYTVTQDDIDDFINSGQTLDNTATATATDPDNTALSESDTVSLDGPVATPTMDVTKTATPTTYAAEGDVISYDIEITNTGNVTWPAPPTIVDALTSDESCPAGAIAPNASVTCTATYTITLDDMDSGTVPNTVDAEITIGGVTEVGTADAEVTAVIETGLSIVKTLASGPNPITADTDELVYEYELTNDGNTRISTFAVSDDKVDVVCPAVTLDPGDSVTCTSVADPYDVLQSDIDDGGVTNTATATAVAANGDTVTSPEVSLTVPATQTSELSLVKASDPDPVLAADFFDGATVDYVYTVTNDGNVTVTDAVTIADDKFGSPITCPAGDIAPGDSIECRATYTITGADVAAGTVINVASASDGTTTSNTDSVAIPQAGAPGITLEKVADTANYDDLSDTLTYTFTVTNSGETVIADSQPITIDDPLIGAPFTCTEQPLNLFPTDSFSCTRTYGPVSQADIDAGQVDNTASASFEAGGLTVTSPSSSATVLANIVPELTLVKSALAADSGAQFDTLNEEIVYTFAVTNDGTQTLTSVEVTDPLISGFSCTINDLAPGLTDDTTCSASYFVTQDDLDNGQIDNTASALGTSPTGLTETATDSATITIDPLAATSLLSVNKSASLSEFAAVGDEILYGIEVSNIGNLTLDDVVITDATLGLTCTIGTLAPLAMDDSCVGSHIITQADIDAGEFVNEASASATGAPTVTSGVTVDGPTRAPSFTVEKTASADTEVAVGTVVTYSHLVTNTGNVTLTDITLTDTHTSTSGGTQSLAFSPSNVIATLAPDATTTVTTTYTITQDDIDAGSDVTNTVSATATPPTGTTVAPATDDEVVDLEDINTALSVVKTESDGSGDFGDLPTDETFTFEVTNDGNVTLKGFTLTDDLTGFSCLLADIPPLTSVTTCDDGSPLSTTYTVLQDDIDTGSLTNAVTVTDGTVVAEDEVTLAGPDQLPLLEMVKTATSGANFDAVGDEVTYDYVVTNDGNITLTAPITVADDKTTVTCPALPAAGLAPDANITCTATYAVTQDDLDAGFVTNAATASISQPVVPSATYPAGTAAVDSDEVTETVTSNQLPEIEIAKAVLAGTASTYSAITDSVTFEFTVTNTGNVTLTDSVTVTDLTIPATLTCPAGGPVTIAPGDAVTCTTTWTPDQGDIDAGSFTNEATAETSFGGNPVATDPLVPATATVTAIQTPEMEMVKVLTGLQEPAPGSAPTTTFASGNVALYSYTITNTGNTTLTSPITIEDNLIGTIACPLVDLAPTDSPMVCTASYVITTDDVELGSVTNIATATDAGGTESEPATETVPGDASPSMSMIKEADVATFNAVGDPIVYTYTVTNTSVGVETSPGVFLRPAFENVITITDDKFPGTAISCLPTADSRLSPDEETTCTATYLVTQEDLDAVQGDGSGGLTSAFVTNNAVAETLYGSTDVVSPAQTVTVDGVAAPALTTTKDVTTGNDPAAVDDVLEYTITTTNTGNQQMSGITVTDAMLPTLTCTINGVAASSPFTLEAGIAGAGDSVICTGSYTVTQDDVDAQVLTNTATAEGSSPDGEVVTTPVTDIHPLVTDSGEITVLKELTAGTPAAAFTDLNQPISFTITVTNDRLVSLENIRVTDSRVAGTCVIPGPLAPGESDSSCEFIYQIQQEDIDAGQLTNVATAVGTPVTPDAEDVTGSDDITVFGPLFEPTLNVTKSADLTEITQEGDLITYTYVIANLGNVTITDQPDLSDDKIPNPADFTCDAIPTGGLAPNESITCTAIYSATQDDVDNGGVTNIATVEVVDTYNGGTVGGTDSVTVPSERSPAMTVLKEASDTTDVALGDIITYTYTVTNTGNVTLEPVTLADDHTSAAGTSALAIEDNGIIASLAPDEIVTLTATYEVTQADIDAGADLTNTVTATPTPPTGTTLDPVTAEETVTIEDAEPSLEVLKTLSDTPDPIVPDVSTVTFEITIENDGNVTLTAPTLTDTLSRADTTLITPNPVPSYVSGDSATTGTVGMLDVGEIWVYTVSHTITQDDIDAGGLSNSVLAEATDPFGTPTEDTSDDGTGAGGKPTTFTIDPEPAVEGIKTITSTTIAVGETVTFEITVENTGNVTLNSVGVASDTLTRADGTLLALTTGPSFLSADMGSSAGNLLVGEIATYTATYVLTQDDIDAGGIENTATVTGSDPDGTPATDVTDNGTGDGDDPTELVIAASPEISMLKTLLSGGPTYNAVDQELVFNFAITNEGNITLTEDVTITDAMITDAGETITCDPMPLAPGDTLNCTGSYFVTQDDIDTGEITNSATAASDETDETTPDTVTVPALQEPELSLLKVADEIQPEDFIVGAIASYTYTVTNTGNVTIVDPITITDNRIAAADITCPVFPTAGVAPDGTYVCTATYTVTVDDVALGSVTNNASASDGTTTSPLTSETIPVDGVPALETLKALFAVNGDESATDFSAVGDILTYEFTVTNDGNVAFANDIFVVDPIIDQSPITCFTSTPANPDLISGESTTCQGTYTVTQDDLDAGEVFNEATSQTSFGVGPTLVESPAGTTTTPADTDPAITLVKSVATLPVNAIDQVLTYTLRITNTGNQTLTDVVGTDALLPNMVCEVDTLDAGDELVCSDTYQVTQDDIDSETLVNTASVSAIDPQGDEATGGDTLITQMPDAEPSFTLAKAANPDPFGAVGSAVLYTFTATNNGTVTLFDVTITDDIADPAYSCTIARLNVGANDNSCTLSYTVTQDDVDAGEIVNVANATATDPFGTVVPATATNTAMGPTQEPALEVVKIASLGGTAVGSEVSYTLNITNTGNVSLTPPVIVDTMTRNNGQSVNLDAPFALQSGDTDNDGLVDVTETWVYTATYTLGQGDLNAGGLSNSVVATAQSPDGTPASDTSDDGDNSDGNTEDDPTEIAIVPGPAINTVKTIVSGVPAVGETITYEIVATNIGNVTLTDRTITDTITRLDGGSADGATTGPTLTSGNAAGIDPGETWVWSFTYEITQDDVDAGGLANTATAGGSAPDGTVVTDQSDNGDDTDGNTTDDDTRFTIIPVSELTVIKELVEIGEAAGEEALFLITVTNTGEATISNVEIVDTMTNNDGTVLTPVTVTVASGDPASLPVGGAITYDVSYTLTQDDVDSGGVSNTAIATGTAPDGTTVSDVSDVPTGGDGSTPTDATIIPDETMVATKVPTTPTRIAPNLYEVTFTMTLENTGNVTQTGLILEDDLTVFASPATLSSVATPVISGFDSGTANASFNGDSDIIMASTDASLAPGSIGVIELTVVYDVSTGQPEAGINTFNATSDRTTVTTQSDPVVPGADPDILAVKTVTPDRATVGQTVTYTMTFTNNLDTGESNLTFVDAMPAGLAYTPNSATYNGSATPQPTVSGRTLLWEDVSLDAGETVTITVQARVTDGGLGDIVNEAYVLDASGNRVSNVASATLRLPVEAVFDCADIIGKVFDDRNMNGYQDGVAENNGITDQTYYADGKFQIAPEIIEPDFEPGLPNVRLSTVDGTIITTDEYGRYSVPCAELPGDIGSNFTLKLDTRSLPSGYQLTTENPRVIRVTAGTMARLNFGATIATVVDIDLMDSAFVPNSDDLTPALIQGVDQLVAALQEDPSILRLTYYRATESQQLARDRMDRLEALIRDRWRRTGAGRLPIERTINRLQ
ncbi:DUF11 domain-containing protein [Octadecabacter sp. 1_MG-2023]|uniref:DUF7507 domain-containing protein n=1 Tax=unclassified Octadecabacter TaxID=196158 RepID=UPI001C0939EC|nr:MULTISPECIES: DUF11 domain-containing protein [unclassified Octadecabacter]MBU2994027.1 DUF11 domain-containing protein [Octadecabacter sp. B2R22]MDO6736030.1 DUF11 domain-containing protein [Octadecabacter sp. 1_MG-2023]